MAIPFQSLIKPSTEKRPWERPPKFGTEAKFAEFTESFFNNPEMFKNVIELCRAFKDKDGIADLLLTSFMFKGYISIVFVKAYQESYAKIIGNIMSMIGLSDEPVKSKKLELEKMNLEESFKAATKKVRNPVTKSINKKDVLGGLLG